MNRDYLKPEQIQVLIDSEKATVDPIRKQVSYQGYWLDDDLGTNWGDNFGGWNSTMPMASREQVEAELAIYKGTAKRIWKITHTSELVSFEPSVNSGLPAWEKEGE